MSSLPGRPMLRLASASVTTANAFDPFGSTVTPPDREPSVSRCRIGRIRDVLGYQPRQPFERTVQELVGLALREPFRTATQTS